MATFLVKRKTEIDTIVVDTLLDGGLNMGAEATDFPVEDGSMISDHIINKPVMMTLSCVVTNTPVDVRGSVVLKVQERPFSTPLVTASASAVPLTRAQDAYIRLKEIRDKREVLTLITGLDVFRNMIITDINIKLGQATTDALFFDVALKQITKVYSKTVQVANLNSAVSDQAADGTNAGNQPTKDLTEQKKQELVGPIYRAVNYKEYVAPYEVLREVPR